MSSREKDVLQRILQDKKRKEIAEELFITENTVKKHISSIFSKLEIESRNELSDRVRSILKQ
ncbi:MAG: response regulator transcription factor [Acetatifactor sp.]